MNSVIEQMLTQHGSATMDDRKNSIKEVVQEILLCGLSRAGFFQSAAFYGGTALRLFYGLDRFSEDLDFSLVMSDSDFRLDTFLPFLEKELLAYGFHFQAESKNKAFASDIQSAFVKGGTREHILLCFADERLARTIGSSERIKIKLEVDTTPPPFANFERRYRLFPVPFEVNLYDMPSLFAGKIHAVICRAWKNRVKGRDLYDYVFYMARQTPVNLRHLNARLIDSGFDSAREEMTIEEIREILFRRFETIDYAQARSDVLPFIRDPASLDVWSAPFFRDITKQLTAQ